MICSMDSSIGMFYRLPKWSVLWIPKMYCFSAASVSKFTTARIVIQERPRDHNYVSPALMGLHGLPVDKRIEYKLLLYTYEALYGLTPWYLCKFVVLYAPRFIRGV